MPAVTRPIAAVLAAGVALSALIARGITRPMQDTSQYRATVDILRDGWPVITRRTPGYPLVLWVTGSGSGETHLLFFVQLAMHVGAVVLVVDLAHRVGVSHRLRLLAAVLLMAPPVTEMARHSSSEAVSELLVVATVWGWFRWREDGAEWCLLLAGGSAALAGLVRPGLVPLFVLLGLAVLLRRREAPDRTRLLRWGAAALLPGVVLLGGLSVLNGVRFDQFGLTPLLPWHLSTRTAGFVEELPASEEPLRSYLVERRDRHLAIDDEHEPGNYLIVNGAREDLERETGLTGAELDRELLRLNLLLITGNPVQYQHQVLLASNRIWQFDAYQGGFGSSGPVGWAAGLIHLALAGAFVLVTAVTGAAAFRRAFRGPAARLWAACLVVAAMNAAVSVLVEIGSPRLRTPTDALLVLALVIGIGVARSERAATP